MPAKNIMWIVLCCILVATATAKKDECITIQSGELVDGDGNSLTVGYDQWGYNYQAHLFNGFYANCSRPDPPVTEDNTYLQMKWNDAWLSNKSCDGDDLLDRHYGFESYIGSGAWLTNHMWGEDENGHWAYFVKIVTAPADATLTDGVWYTADGTEIGPVIWGTFAIIQEVESGQGATYISPAGPGLGQVLGIRSVVDRTGFYRLEKVDKHTS